MSIHIEKINELLAVENGWYDGIGLCPTHTALQYLHHLLGEIEAVPCDLSFFPKVHGGLLVEQENKQLSAECSDRWSLEISSQGFSHITTVIDGYVTRLVPKNVQEAANSLEHFLGIDMYWE